MFAAWIIHNVIKRNNDKHWKDFSPIDLECLSLSDALSAQQATQSSTLSNTTGESAERTIKRGGSEANANSKVIFDPIRNL